jgi:hypothetical protein
MAMLLAVALLLCRLEDTDRRCSACYRLVCFLVTRLTVDGNGRRLGKQTLFDFDSDSQFYEGAVHLFL